MTEKQEKVFNTLMRVRDRLEKLASRERAGFFKKEDQEAFMECANVYSDAARGIDWQMQRLSTGDRTLTEIDARRNRILEYKF